MKSGDNMTYEQALTYINENSQNKIIPGLDNMNKLCSLLGDPQNKVKTIHIAGTNGKGSVGAFIAAGLISNGYNVARYTSPAVLDYRDKFTYNNVPISKEEFSNITFQVKSKIESSGCKPTVFELETAIAFYFISTKNCDFAIIETGMGGRLDATNVCDKILSVITPVALDHTNFLGSSIEEIAEEKAGIIKDCLISADQDIAVKNIFLKHTQNAVFVDSSAIKNVKYTLDKTTFDYKNHHNIEITMLGKYQVENACLAVETLEKLNSMGFSINNIASSLKNAQWQCRFQKISENPLIIADGAHNPHGIKALKENFNIYFKDKPTVFITGVFKDKDYNKMAEIICPYAFKIFTVNSHNVRALPAKEYAYAISKYNKNVQSFLSIQTAVKSALKYQNILVFGSLSFMAEIYDCFKEELWKDTTKY